MNTDLAKNTPHPVLKSIGIIYPQTYHLPLIPMALHTSFSQSCKR